MKLPTLPADKANHVIYGYTIGTVTLLMLNTLIFILLTYSINIFDVKTVLMLQLILPILSALIGGKLKEMLDAKANKIAISKGVRKPHSVESADIKFTSFGGAMVSLIILAMLI